MFFVPIETIDAPSSVGYTTVMASDEFLKRDGFLTKELLKLALASSDIGVWKVDPRTRAVELSSTMKAMLGMPIDQHVDYASFLNILHPDDRESARAGLARALDPTGDGQCDVEFRVAPASGGTRWLYARGAAFFTGEAGDRTPNLFIGTMRDVTENKAAESLQRDAVEQQRELLHEVNHRVKNSLQLVSSLLRLQARSIQDRDTRRYLDDATARISTIAKIHQRLYRDQDFRRLNFGGFLSEMCADLQGSAPDCPIKVLSPDFMVTTDRAVPLALVINELVTNAFEYAYPGSSGPVTVTVPRSGAGEVTIQVEDIGVGLPAGFSVKGAGTLGMTLVLSLVAQLSGRVETLPRERGTCFAVTIPNEDKG
jgi:PAS domain S-box-containing protein